MHIFSDRQMVRTFVKRDIICLHLFLLTLGINCLSLLLNNWFTIVQRKTPPCIKIRTNLLWIICPSDNRLHMSGRLVPTVLSSYLIDLAHYPLTFINRRKRERQHSFSFSSKFGILIFLPTRICLPPL